MFDVNLADATKEEIFYAVSKFQRWFRSVICTILTSDKHSHTHTIAPNRHSSYASVQSGSFRQPSIFLLLCHASNRNWENIESVSNCRFFFKTIYIPLLPSRLPTSTLFDKHKCISSAQEAEVLKNYSLFGL